MVNGTPVVLPAELEPSFITDRIGRAVARAASVAAKGIEEWRAGGIRSATLQEVGDLTAELYWLRREVLASGELSQADFRTIARNEGLKTLRKYYGHEPSDSVLELLVDGELEILDQVVAAAAQIN
jgi:hypothetical protein